MYRQVILPDISDGISKSEFQHQIRKWTRIEEAQEPDALKRKGSNKVCKPCRNGIFQAIHDNNNNNKGAFHVPH